MITETGIQKIRNGQCSPKNEGSLQQGFFDWSPIQLVGPKRQRSINDGELLLNLMGRWNRGLGSGFWYKGRVHANNIFHSLPPSLLVVMSASLAAFPRWTHGLAAGETMSFFFNASSSTKRPCSGRVSDDDVRCLVQPRNQIRSSMQFQFIIQALWQGE
ncbi:hypothetical protein M413DRAFT_276845 [Hebeloma cylindrosporum]|uniref:Uncharacterized protein n=1 Tax=Hebeloma cylindrosporum TaxID=76867 RepID=A0A0C3C0U5_HEBCY|nr:hypothetical protein M413DRAFT_276845 [Hebeloma cylindrosporum h7]